MRLRLSLLVVLVAVVALLAAGGSVGAPSAVGIDDYVGFWTADSSSNSTLSGRSLRVEAVSRATAAADVGPDWNADFFKYCDDPQIRSESSFLQVVYNWNPSGVMGGCISPRTGGHIYFFGKHKDVGYGHIGTVDGEKILKGFWGTYTTGPVTYLPFTAHRPTAKFIVHAQGHHALKGKGHKFELSTALGVGGLQIKLESALEPGNVLPVVSGIGTIHIHRWKVFPHGVIDEDNLTLAVVPSGIYRETESGARALNQVGVVVRKADAHETDDCPVGTTGQVGLGDGLRGGDLMTIDMAGDCGLKQTYDKAKLGKAGHVAVAISLENLP